MNQLELLSWKEIKNRFGGAWVELIDVEWDWNTPYPSFARVRNHSWNRSNLLNQVEKLGMRADGVILHLATAHSLVEHPAVAVL